MNLNLTGHHVEITPPIREYVSSKLARITHHFDHVTQWLKGRFKVTATLPTGVVIVREFKAWDYCLIRADVFHEIEALEDDCLAWCVYSHLTPQGEVVQQYTGWPESYT